MPHRRIFLHKKHVDPLPLIWHLMDMQLSTTHRIACCLGILLVVLTACQRNSGEADAAEAGNAVAQAAYAAMDAGQWEDAVKLFHDVLEQHPELSRMHLDAAMLLQDHVDDPVRAVYHYARYLELRPKTEKKALIQERILQARRSIGASGLAPEQTAEKAAELAAARESARLLQEKLAATSSVRTELSRALGQLKRERALTAKLTQQKTRSEKLVKTTEASQRKSMELSESQRDRIDGMEKLLEAAGLDVNGKPLKRAPNAGPNAIARSYTVRRGDSLSKIAYKVYGDATLWRRIQKANDQILRDSVNVQVGQVLVIP
jgi:LysM repeat protein